MPVPDPLTCVYDIPFPYRLSFLALLENLSLFLMNWFLPVCPPDPHAALATVSLHQVQDPLPLNELVTSLISSEDMCPLSLLTWPSSFSSSYVSQRYSSRPVTP